MSKAFRNLDVDRFEGGFEGDDGTNQVSPISVNESEIQKLLASGRHLEAIQAILVPVGFVADCCCFILAESWLFFVLEHVQTNRVNCQLDDASVAGGQNRRNREDNRKA